MRMDRDSTIPAIRTQASALKPICISFSRFIFIAWGPTPRRTPIHSAKIFRASPKFNWPRFRRWTLHPRVDGLWRWRPIRALLFGPDGQWHQIARLSDEITGAAFGTDGDLYLLSHLNAPKGKILRTSLAHPSVAEAQTVVPESKAVIERFLPLGKALYVQDVLGGPSQIRIFDASGKLQGQVPIAPLSAVEQMARSASGELLVQSQTYLEPRPGIDTMPRLERCCARRCSTKPSADYSDAEVLRVFAISKDGTKFR